MQVWEKQGELYLTLGLYVDIMEFEAEPESAEVTSNEQKSVDCEASGGSDQATVASEAKAEVEDREHLPELVSFAPESGRVSLADGIAGPVVAELLTADTAGSSDSVAMARDIASDSESDSKERAHVSLSRLPSPACARSKLVCRFLASSGTGMRVYFGMLLPKCLNKMLDSLYSRLSQSAVMYSYASRCGSLLLDLVQNLTFGDLVIILQGICRTSSSLQTALRRRAAQQIPMAPAVAAALTMACRLFASLETTTLPYNLHKRKAGVLTDFLKSYKGGRWCGCL